VTLVREIPLRGAGGEPVDFARTIVSHGVAELPPNRVDLAGRALETTLPVGRGARTVRITARGKKLRIEGSDDPKLTQTVAHMSRLDEDLSTFYGLVREDELAWCALGAGRMLRAPTVFEDVVKTNRPFIRILTRTSLAMKPKRHRIQASHPRTMAPVAGALRDHYSGTARERSQTSQFAGSFRAKLLAWG
jgi:hypothetical protein